MRHLEQHHFGKPSRARYHNKAWAKPMRDVGLIPSDTGAPGGKEVGRRASHIEAGGRFERACADLAKRGFDPLYVELWSEGGKKIHKKKAASKRRYTCPECETNAWATPNIHLISGDCDARMVAEDEAFQQMGRIRL